MKPRDRWAEGIPHDERSVAIVRALMRIDFDHFGDYFGWKFGGDGDNGEMLAYELDVYFEEQDAAAPVKCPWCGGVDPDNHKPRCGFRRVATGAAK